MKFYIAIASILFLETEASRKRMMFTNTQLDLNPKYCINGSSFFSQDQDQSSIFFNIEFDIIMNFKHAYINFLLQRYDHKLHEYNPWLANETVSVCSLLKAPNKAKFHYLVQKLFVLFYENSNTIRCIYKVGKMFLIGIYIYIYFPARPLLL